MHWGTWKEIYEIHMADELNSFCQIGTQHPFNVKSVTSPLIAQTLLLKGIMMTPWMGQSVSVFPTVVRATYVSITHVFEVSESHPESHLIQSPPQEIRCSYQLHKFN